MQELSFSMPEVIVAAVLGLSFVAWITWAEYSRTGGRYWTTHE